MPTRVPARGKGRGGNATTEELARFNVGAVSSGIVASTPGSAGTLDPNQLFRQQLAEQVLADKQRKAQEAAEEKERDRVGKSFHFIS